MRYLPLLLVCTFWALSLWNLDRFPYIHEDEPWVLSPGYKLFTVGVYGSDLFMGFHRIEQVYLEFLPLMSLLQGAGARFFGVGVMQMRFLPVALGALTLALAYSLARRLCLAAGLLAMLLLLTWQWSPPGNRWFASGVPLLDLSRIARYDILVAPLGLGALWCYIRAREGTRVRYDFFAGLLAGLAGLAHMYGLFWVIALLLLALVEQRSWAGRPSPCSGRRWRSPAAILLGAAAAWCPWVVVVLTNWSAYVGQNFQYADRFALDDPAFYLNNLLNEARRYRLGIFEAATFLRLGFWLLVLGAPLALTWLGVRVLRLRQRQELWLFVPCLAIPLLFALLIKLKQYNYVAPLVPLFAILIAWAGSRLLRASRRPVRVLVWLAAALLVLQGSFGIAQVQAMAGRVESPHPFFAELRQAVPPGARVLGLPRFWLALTDYDYRSFALPFIFSNPRISQQPISLEAAMAHIAPDIVLIDPIMADVFSDRTTPLDRERSAALLAYMQQRRARLIQDLRDHHGEFVHMYRIEQLPTAMHLRRSVE